MRVKIKFCMALLPVMVFGAVAFAQNGYYRNPMDIEMIFSSNFGEVRSNHFHSGVDLKTGGVEGKKVFAAADGYISRIGIVPSGFGRVLYITHPNGTMTVYAHLRDFTPEIEDYVKEARYKQKQSAINLYLDSTVFPVKKGQLIGYSGNSGTSTGPHLHYELRDASQSPVNIVTQGIIKPLDNIPPQILKLYQFSVDTVSGAPIHKLVSTQIAKKSVGNKYVVPVAAKYSDNTYFAVEVTDRKNNTTNKYGIYRIVMKVDSIACFEFCMDKFSYDNTRFVNAFTAYEQNKATANDVIKLVRPASSPLRAYRTSSESGLIGVGGGDHKVDIEVSDDSGNSSVLSFTMSAAPASAKSAVKPDGTTVVKWNTDFSLTTDSLTVKIPKGALYESIFYSQKPVQAVVQSASGAKVVSGFYKTDGTKTPLQKAATVTIKCSLPDSLRAKAKLAMLSSAGKLSSLGGSWSRGAVSTTTNSFGTYCVAVDTTPPTIKSSFTDGADLTNSKSVWFTFSDNFSGVASFSATIDGKWIIFEQKSNRITHYFDDELIQRGTRHTLVLTVTDGSGNRKVFTASFRR